MQIVIEIPDFLYQIIQDCKVIEGSNEGNLENVLIKAVENGVALPKGHGDLIDRNDLFITTITTDDYNGNEVIDVVLKEDVDSAQTIIEADKGER